MRSLFFWSSKNGLTVYRFFASASLPRHLALSSAALTATDKSISQYRLPNNLTKQTFATFRSNGIQFRLTNFKHNAKGHFHHRQTFIGLSSAAVFLLGCFYVLRDEETDDQKQPKQLRKILGLVENVHLVLRSIAGDDLPSSEFLKFAYCVDATKLPGDAARSAQHDRIFSKAEVQKHKNKESGIWVTYNGGVYDITEFADLHPGGDKILLAAGGALEPFWNLYAVHKTPEVKEILEELRIGRLDASEVSIGEDLNDPYAKDPERHPALRQTSLKPFNAETPPELLTDNFNTPSDLFFVRNHLPVPNVDIQTYRLKVDGRRNPLGKALDFTLADLKKRFPVVTLSATLQCAGNRRSEMNRFKKVKGLDWSFTAISNAEWRGVRLRDVLIASGWTQAKIDELGVRHVHFEGLDCDPTGQPYGASISIEKAMSPAGDVILAFEMNGEALSRDHGFPLRVIAPGIVGARNVKWLSKIYLSDVESSSHWQQNDYKCFSPSTDWDTVDFKKAPAIQEAPVQSAICFPCDGTILPKGTREVTAKGYAWSGGGRGIVRVDVSADGGKTWHVANLEQQDNQDRMWSWTLWNATLPLTSVNEDKSVELICKAVDRSYNNQPESAESIWNLRGCLNNAWHRIRLKTA